MEKHILIATEGKAQAFEEIGVVAKIYNRLVEELLPIEDIKAGYTYDAFDATLKDGLVEFNIGKHKVYVIDYSLGHENGHLEEYFTNVLQDKIIAEESYMTLQFAKFIEAHKAKTVEAIGFVATLDEGNLVVIPLKGINKLIEGNGASQKDKGD